LILSDINMPGMTGGAFAQGQGASTRCPCHHDHRYGDADTKRMALENGADTLQAY